MKKFVDFSKGLIPAIIQDYQTKEFLMLGYMNEGSLKKTINSGFVWFWSRERKTLWMKGEMSGNKLKVDSIKTDCDNDALLIQVELIGRFVCHKGKRSCFNNRLDIKKIL